MFLAQLLLTALVVFQLVRELRLVLQAGELRAGALDGVQVPELQLLGGLVLAQQHGTLQILLGLLFVQLLKEGKTTPGMKFHGDQLFPSSIALKRSGIQSEVEFGGWGIVAAPEGDQEGSKALF